MFTFTALNVTHIDVYRVGYSEWKVDAVVKVNINHYIIWNDYFYARVSISIKIQEHHASFVKRPTIQFVQVPIILPKLECQMTKKYCQLLYLYLRINTMI